ncbi:hypothetical protein PC39_06609 [Salinisphaera sp. PC39]|uniref:DUF1295 domain-containing protein n=1 Tax=Salinisphaera sp. PC39 TaxID=1304156 RepID=UPI003341A5B6
MEPLIAYLLGLAVAVALVTATWLVQLATHDAGVVDAVWSATLGLLGLLYAAVGDAPAPVRLLLAVMAGAWAFRLAAHLALRMRGRPEDARYAAARRAWGRRADLYMLLFFWFQAVVAWVLSLPFLVIAYRPDMPAAGWLAAAGIVWLVSVAGEALADRQLERFRRDPANAGRVCDRGLWRYSRHPNYFFECLHWLAYPLLAAGAPYWWATLASPAIMAWLLLRVSGIPTVESAEGKSRRIGYDDYVRRTSAFIPLPPKRN